MNPIQQPLEGAHPAKEDVPGPPSTSAVAGEGKGEPAEENTTEAEAEAEEVRDPTIFSG